MAYKFVIVRWQDSCVPRGANVWMMDCDKPVPCVCVTAGWLVRKTKDVLVIAQSIGNLSHPVDYRNNLNRVEIARRQITDIFKWSTKELRKVICAKRKKG